MEAMDAIEQKSKSQISLGKAKMIPNLFSIITNLWIFAQKPHFHLY